MWNYFLRRTLIAIPTLIAISFVIFALLSLAPGDPMSQFATNPDVPPEVRENIKRSLGLDRPWYIRYFYWLIALPQGDWGFSFAARKPVLDFILERLPQTLAVVGVSYIVGVVIAIPIGVITSVRPKSLFSNIVAVFTMAGISLPTFLTGTILLIVFSVNLGWLPMIYDTQLKITSLETLWKQIRQSLMPITVLALFNAGAMTRFVRAAMLENLPMDYVRTARAKGLGESVVVIRHALRNSLIPVVTLIAIGIPAIFAGAIITEQIFRVNGIGELLISSINRSDTPVVMGIVFIFAVLVVFSSLIADVLMALLDPRIKLS
ncbi:MAG: ABC transporter permease [Anaerolineae bacterium]|nr:ABC transporter permease [Anaerolineae bacterium]